MHSHSKGRLEPTSDKSTAVVVAVLLSTACPIGSALAQFTTGGGPSTTGERASTHSGAAVRIGPVEVYPSVRYDLKLDDNIFFASGVAPAGSTQVKKSDTIQVLTPELRAEAKRGPHTFGAGIGLQLGRYADSSTDNYNTNNAFLSADLNPQTRIGLRLRAEHIDGADARGTTNDPFTQTPNRYRQLNLRGTFAYGAPGAKGRIELELGSLGKRYYNNAESGVQRNNRDDTLLGGSFYWRFAPKTSLLAQVRRTGIDYRDDTATLDSTGTTYYLGLTWEATAKTTGIIKFGLDRKDFSDSARADASSPSWDAQIRWSPLTYSTWDFILSRRFRETSVGAGDAVLSSASTAQWSHQWNNRVSTAVTGSYVIDEYKGIARKDKLPTLGLKAAYQLRRWLDIGADYTWSRRNSDVAGNDYKKNVFMFFLSATL